MLTGYRKISSRSPLAIPLNLALALTLTLKPKLKPCPEGCDLRVAVCNKSTHDFLKKN